MHNADTYTGASFSLSNRIGRVVWNISNILFFRFSPRPLHGWRNFLLRLFGAKIGKGVHIYPGVKIWAPWNLEIGNEAGIGNGAILYSQAKIIVGYRATISQGTHVCTGTHDYTKAGQPLIAFPITIGDRAWVAAEAFIHPGVSIGEGAVIGARAVVTQDMPPWMVCAGHPCKPLKARIITD
ncbi:MAG: putative colanic acid biosynthesis acetyltransferase [Chitinophagaceae bacterium]|nr:MAG: putative colanic acid biosynthesis acetyltransferase [Chitinophagaceae bacterium]